MKPAPSRVGPYIVLGELGHGAMGAVYLAEHGELRRTVALKILTGDYQKDHTLLLRFKREAEAAMALSHPSLVKVFDFGEEGGTYYLGMELVQGRSLARVLDDGGPVPAERAIKLVRDVLEGLAVCHDAGLVHRDIKPSNLMIDETGRARVLDLGMIKVLDRTILTRDDCRIGSPRYVSPEMVLTGQVDGRSDLYQVGLVLYECLGGRPAFPDTSLPVLLQKIVNDPPARLVGIAELKGGLIQGFLDRCLAKSPEGRFSSCRDALAHLSGAGRAISRPRRRLGETLKRFLPARAPGTAVVRLCAGVMTAVALCFLLGLGWVRLRPEPPATPASPSPAVRFVDGAWEVRWTGAVPEKGAIEVRDGASRLWVRIEEDSGATTVHRVRFERWPVPGRRLTFRVRHGDRSAGPELPLEEPAARAPLELSVDPVVTTASVSWKTAAVTTGIVSILASGVTTRELSPTQHHSVVIRGLSPGSTVTLSIRGDDRRELARWKGSMPRVAAVAERVIQALDWAKKARARIQAECPRSGRPTEELHRFGQRWLEASRQWTSSPPIQRVVSMYLEAREALFESGEVAPGMRSMLLRRLSEIADLEHFVKELAGVTLGLPVEQLSGPPILAAPPAGVEPIAVFRFADGGQSVGRVVPASRLEPIRIAPPAVFGVESQNMLDLVGYRSARFEFVHRWRYPVPTNLKSAYLGFRVTANSLTEKLAVRFAGRGDLPRIERDTVGMVGALLGVRVPGRPLEGCVRIDERTLEASAALRVEYEYVSPTLIPKGMTLDHLIIYVGR